YVLAGSSRETPLSLIFVAIDLLSMGFAFLIFTSLRTHSLAYFPDSVLKNIGIPILVGGGTLSLYFLLANMFPFMFDHWRTLPFLTYPLLVSGIVCYMFLYLCLIRYGQRVKFAVATLATTVCIMLVITARSDYHHVRTLDIP